MPAATPRPATPIDRENAVKTVTDGVKGLVGITNDLFSDRPGFIQGGGGSWPLADAVRSVSQYNCRQWARADKSGFSARVNAGNAALCNPYLDDIGMLPDDGSFPAPWLGGQCATSYSVPIWVRQVDGSEGVVTNLSVTGPISSITRTFVSPNVYRFDVVGAGGSAATTTQPNLTFGAEPRSGFYDPVGTPNDCGNPPGDDYEAPGSTTGGPSPDTNITINIPGIGPTTVTVEPNEDGDPVVCFIEAGVCVEIPISGGGQTAPPSGPPPGGGTAGTPQATGEGGEAEDDAPEGEMLWGLKINITSFPANPNEYAPGVYRAVCYVYIGDDDGLDHDPAGAMLRDGQFVFAERDYLTKWKVVANDDYNLTVTPYYKPQEQSP